MFNKKIVDSFSVLALTLVLAVSGTIIDANTASVVAEGNTTEVNETSDTNQEVPLLAGAIATIAEAEETYEAVSVETEEVDIVTAAEQGEENDLTEEETEWLTHVMANVEESLNVRAEASAESELVGKLFAGDLATVVEEGTEWTKIVSGNLEGYVKNEYCVFGLDALAYAKKNCETVAKVTTQGLRMREEQSTDSAIVATLDEGNKTTVNLDVECQEGWLYVSYKDNSGYVSTDYVDTYIKTGTGKTCEEIEEEEAEAAAAKAAAEAEKAAKKAAAEKTSSSQTQGTETTQQAAVSASTDETVLLAAIIYCEAGGEGYDAQLAVGAVVMNRVRSGSYPSTIYDVIYQKGQFGPASSGRLAKVLSKGSYSSTSYSAALAALAGEDNTGGAYSFRDLPCSKSGVVYGSMIFF